VLGRAAYPPPFKEYIMEFKKNDLKKTQGAKKVSMKHEDQFHQESHNMRLQIRRTLGQLSPRHLDVLKDIRQQSNVVDAFQGAHVVVHDRGELYGKWSKLGAQPRISSHYQNVKVQQYEIKFPGMGAVLFGKTPEGQSWFQMEAHSGTGFDALLHLGDYFQSVASGGKNIGPMGQSEHSEKRGRELHRGNEGEGVGEFFKSVENT
jgi:hypothetical protein